MGKLFKKVIVTLSLLIVVLLAIAGVNASNNITEDVMAIENDNTNAINVNEVDSIEESIVSVYDDNKLSVSDNEDPISEGSYLKKGPSGYIDSDDMTITYKNPIGYSVRLVGGSPLGESVGFIIYKGDSGTHVGNYYTTADSNGYAYLNEDLKPDTYWIQMVSDNYGSVYNTLTVKINGYSNAKIDITDTYYKYSGGDVIFHWEGYLNGYFNIYKGSNLIHKKQIYPDASGVNTDGDFSEYVYLTKKLSIGSYTVKITDNNGKVIKQASFKVTKMPTYVYCPNVKYTSGGTKYITVKVYDKINDNWATGTVKVKINGKTYKGKLKDGMTQIKAKLPSKTKTYSCKVTFLENSKFKSSSKTFKITVKKATNKKKTTSFTVILPVKLNQYTSKTIGKYKFRAYKHIEYNSNGRDYGVTTTLFKNNKAILLNKYESIHWWHFKSGNWKYMGKGRTISYNEFSNVDKIKVKITIK